MTFLAADLNSAGPLITSLTTASKFISLTAGFTTVGLLIAMGFLLLDQAGKLSSTAISLRNYAVTASAIWVAGQALNILATLANILGTDLAGALDPTSIRSFISQIALGKYMFIQLCLALFVCTIVVRAKTVATTNFLST
jgi:putative copper resistance protein D